MTDRPKTDQPKDVVDHHVARWANYWENNPGFVPAVEGVLIRMGHILRWLRRQDVAYFARSDLTLEDYKTLHALMVQPYPTEATPAQLAEVTKVTRAAMTSRLDRLVSADLVTRETEPNDRRRVVIRPTAAGRAAWDRHIFEQMARERAVFSALTTDELEQLNTLLRKVILSFSD